MCCEFYNNCVKANVFVVLTVDVVVVFFFSLSFSLARSLSLSHTHTCTLTLLLSHSLAHLDPFLKNKGGYDPKKPATPLALSSMTKWLQARQDGVTAARSWYRSTTAGAAASAGNVFFSAEVNLVQDSRTTGAPNMINKVIPYVCFICCYLYYYCLLRYFILILIYIGDYIFVAIHILSCFFNAD